MNRKVLIVDDDRLNLTLLNIGLRNKDYDVCMAHDGQEALAVLSSENPHIIVLDIQMPTMNGYEFMKELQTRPGAKIPVIMLTANETMQDVFFMEGVRGYMVKPVNLEELDKKIKKILG